AERDRPARADAGPGLARGGVHGAHPRRRRVPDGRSRRAARGGGRVSTTSATVAIPELREYGRVTQARVVVSEWTKLHSLRSTRWSLGVGVLLTVAFPVIFATVTATHWAHMSAHDRADRHPLDIALAGVNVAQLAIAVLGVLVITGEYSTGMIRSTFLAVPKRLPVLWAKTGVFAVVTFVLIL